MLGTRDAAWADGFLISTPGRPAQVLTGKDLEKMLYITLFISILYYSIIIPSKEGGGSRWEENPGMINICYVRGKEEIYFQ